MNHDSRSFEDDLSSLKADVAVIRSNYATKADLQEVRIELKAEIQVVRSELKVDFQEVRAELGQVRRALKADIEEVRAELASAKNELKQDIGVLRQDMIELKGDSQVNIEKLRGEMHAMGEKFSDAINAQTWKMIGFAAALVVASHFATRAGF